MALPALGSMLKTIKPFRFCCFFSLMRIRWQCIILPHGQSRMSTAGAEDYYIMYGAEDYYIMYIMPRA